MKSRMPVSLRGRLAITYAGIALLTAALLGGILLSVLNSYYARAEVAYLEAAATRIKQGGIPAIGSPVQRQWVAQAAVLTQTRVKRIDERGNVVADSGPVADLSAAQIRGELPERRGDRDRERLPEPLGGGLFAGDSAQVERSDRTLTIGLGPSKYGAGYLELSEPPVSSRAVLVGIAQAWVVAALLAVAIAAQIGYFISRRISHPVAALTEASDRMADGDLSARAPEAGEDEFGRLADSFNTMAERMQGTIASLRRFVADAAHEIGTPLTALEADLELAEKAATTADERRLVARATGQARRLEALSQGLLQLSRIEAGDVPVEPEPVDVANLARDAADAVASRAEQACLVLSVEIGPEPLIVIAERAQLQTALGNLLDNAIKFTPEGGSVTVSATRADTNALIVVADTGVGIPLAEQDMVFQRFHRGRNAAAYPGSGLGLAIVKAAVERAGGAITFASSDSGTRFEARLPLAKI